MKKIEIGDCADSKDSFTKWRESCSVVRRSQAMFRCSRYKISSTSLSIRCNQKKTIVYDLSNCQMTSSVAIAMFAGVCEALMDADIHKLRSTPLYVEMTDNRLTDMKKDGFACILKTLEQFPWMCVRFGYEIMVHNLQEAMAEDGAETMMNTRVYVERPWDIPSNRRLADAIADLAVTNKKLEKLENLDQIMSELKKSNEKVCDVAKRSYTDIQHCIKTQATSLEYQMAEALVEFLPNSRIVAVNRKFKYEVENSIGDIDCVVEGEFEGRQVVIIGEAKMNIPQKKKLAADQLQVLLARWKDMYARLWEAKDDPDLAADIAELEVERLGERPIVFAVGGLVFPPEDDEYFTKRFGNRRWLRVHPGGARGVTACGGGDACSSNQPNML